MVQAIFPLPQAGPLSMAAFVTNDLNPALDAILSKNSGSSAPTSPLLAGQEWINTSTNPWGWFVYDGASWLQIGTINPTTHAITILASILGGSSLPSNITTIAGVIANLQAQQISLPTNLLMSSTTPALGVSSGFGTGATVSSSNGTAAFAITCGSSPGNTGTINMPSAANGWACMATDTSSISAPFLVKQTGYTNNTIVLGGVTDTGSAASFVNTHVITCVAFAF